MADEDLEGEGIGLLQVISREFAGGTEEYMKNFSDRVTRPRFETSTSILRV
jgi:hypothetical protein